MLLFGELDKHVIKKKGKNIFKSSKRIIIILRYSCIHFLNQFKYAFDVFQWFRNPFEFVIWLLILYFLFSYIDCSEDLSNVQTFSWALKSFWIQNISFVINMYSKLFQKERHTCLKNLFWRKENIIVNFDFSVSCQANCRSISAKLALKIIYLCSCAFLNRLPQTALL